MRTIKTNPILTITFDQASAFTPDPESLYLYANSTEDRSSHVSSWVDRASNLNLIEITEQLQTAFKISNRDESVSLRSERQLTNLWSENTADNVYLDITGLSHHVWAPLLRSLLLSNKKVNVVYVEPHKYRKSSAPVDGQIYDLSERITGIAPIPGFASLAERNPSAPDIMFVACLGFEGARLAYTIEQIQPNNEKIIPIIGCPGFHPEYTFESYLGNKRPLLDTCAWEQVRFAPANCPFSVFYLLGELAQSNASSRLQLAIIGTKPHALGAILFKLLISPDAEIIYDHPIRRAGRSDGTERLHVYHVSALKNELSAH